MYSTPNSSKRVAISSFFSVLKKALANCSPSRRVDSMILKLVTFDTFFFVIENDLLEAVELVPNTTGRPPVLLYRPVAVDLVTAAARAAVRG